MKIEHLALNVADANAVAGWYIEHLGFSVKLKLTEAPFTHFLADDSGTVMLEIYQQPAPVPDYAALEIMSLHLALVSEDVEADCQRLVASGAVATGPIQHAPGGDVMVFLRDPWGLTLQLVRRARPMVR